MNDRPYLAINWAGASEGDKAKALAAINAAFAAIGMTASHGATVQFARESEELDFASADDPEIVDSKAMSQQEHDAADLWMIMEEIAAKALGMDPHRDKLPDFNGWIEPWVSAAEAQRAVDSWHQLR